MSETTEDVSLPSFQGKVKKPYNQRYSGIEPEGNVQNIFFFFLINDHPVLSLTVEIKLLYEGWWKADNGII